MAEKEAAEQPGMAVLDEQQLLEREAAFMKAHAPDTYGFVLDQLRPSLYRLHAAGYSRAMLFTFLTSEGLVACGRATFYRWLKTQVDLDAGAREVLASRAPARSSASVSTGAAPATATPPPPYTNDTSRGATPSRPQLGAGAAIARRDGGGEGAGARPDIRSCESAGGRRAGERARGIQRGFVVNLFVNCRINRSD